MQLVLEGFPDEGDSFTYDLLSVTVTKCDEKMVKEINVKKLESLPDEDEKDKKESKDKRDND